MNALYHHEHRLFLQWQPLKRVERSPHNFIYKKKRRIPRYTISKKLDPRTLQQIHPNPKQQKLKARKHSFVLPNIRSIEKEKSSRKSPQHALGPPANPNRPQKKARSAISRDTLPGPGCNWSWITREGNKKTNPGQPPSTYTHFDPYRHVHVCK